MGQVDEEKATHQQATEERATAGADTLSAAAETLVELKGIEKTYKKGKETVPVLSNLDLNIQRGDFLALMGPSGSGKSTLLNLLGGLDHPTAGVLKIDGTRVDQLTGSALTKWRARHVGFIFQFYNLMPVLTTEKNVELPLLLTSLSSKQRKQHVATALELVGLQERAKHYPTELSGGQEQRVAIARAIVSDPTLLLCDEPTGDLDRRTADDILDLMQTLNDVHQKTIIMVTHDPKAAAYAKHTLNLNKGALEPGEG